MAAGILLICLLPMKASKKPLMILLVPRVTMNEGRRNRAIKMELNMPSTTPMRAPTANSSSMGAPL